MIGLKTILHPTDFSEPSRYALELACTLAREQGARVVLLHVLPRPVTLMPSDVPPSRSLHAEEDLRHSADGDLADDRIFPEALRDEISVVENGSLRNGRCFDGDLEIGSVVPPHVRALAHRSQLPTVTR